MKNFYLINPTFKLDPPLFVNFYYNFNISLLLLASQEKILQLDISDFTVLNDGFLVTAGLKNDPNNLITNFYYDNEINYLIIFHKGVNPSNSHKI